MTTGSIGSIGSLTEDQQAVCRHLPQPIAAAWQEVLLARTNAQLEQRLLSLTDVTLRTLGVLALVDYLRGPPVRQVEQLLPGLEEPQPEIWFALLNACVDAIFQRAEPKPFALELLVWAHGPRGEPAAGQRLVEQVLELRRELVHSTDTLIIEESGTTTERLLGAVLSLCDSLAWLGLYRLMRPSTMATRRHSGFHGRMQLLVGGAENPPAVDAAWTAHLVLDTVYWSNPDASALLEISPLMRVLPHPRLKRSQCFLFAGAPHLKRLQLRHDPSEVTVETAVQGHEPGEEWTFVEWLGKRAEHQSCLENRDLTGTLAVDPQITRAPPRKRPQSRPIPDLSAEAFRQPSSRGGRRPQSSLTLEQKRQKQWLLLGQVFILVVIVVTGARLLGTAKGRERAVYIDDRGVASVVAKTRGTPETEVALPDAATLAHAVTSTAELERVAQIVREQRRETELQAARQIFAQGQAMAESQPAYAALKWEMAAYRGDWQGDRQLARMLAGEVPLQKTRCIRHALRALRALPADGELTLIATKCGMKSGDVMPDDIEAWTGDLRNRLVTQGHKLVQGEKMASADQRKWAKSLYADAGSLGSAKAWLALAKLAWKGDRAAEECRHGLAEAGKLGGLSDAELKEVAELRADCGM